jgi:protein gp37
MKRTKIPWAKWVWNPVTGCSEVSEGCKNCYARVMSERFGWPWGRATEHPERLEELKVKNYRATRGVCFVCSMGDLWHPTVDPVFRSVVMQRMEQRPDVTFVLLTKRAMEMGVWLDSMLKMGPWPKHIWVGFSAENQERFDERWGKLQDLSAEVPMVVSVEPMLGPVTMGHFGRLPRWVIAGPETGRRPRECRDEWIEDLKGEAQVRGCMFFDKRKGVGLVREGPV